VTRRKLAHFYHVYADGVWQEPALDHLEALVRSGLLDRLDEMYLGIVGRPELRKQVRHRLPGVVVAESDTGWEQVTLRELHGYALNETANVFYAHTKGASSQTPLAEGWRVSMTHDTVTRWRECVEGLERSDAAGPFWLKSQDPLHAGHDHFFAGNYWYARSEYLRTLPTVENEHRYQAEGWIGLGNPSVTSLRSGLAWYDNFWRPS
jgi:hypothetical protein